jgi:hypothetical protein
MQKFDHAFSELMEAGASSTPFWNAAAVVCTSCRAASVAHCPTHQVLLTNQHGNSTLTCPTPSCTSQLDFATAVCNDCHCQLASYSWVLTRYEAAYLKHAFTDELMHPVLQCSTCKAVNFPGVTGGLVSFKNGQIIDGLGVNHDANDWTSYHVPTCSSGSQYTIIEIRLNRTFASSLVTWVSNSSPDLSVILPRVPSTTTAPTSK